MNKETQQYKNYKLVFNLKTVIQNILATRKLVDTTKSLIRNIPGNHASRSSFLAAALFRAPDTMQTILQESGKNSKYIYQRDKTSWGQWVTGSMGHGALSEKLRSIDPRGRDCRVTHV